MAATTYQILYRATNFNTGIVITNNPSVHVEHMAEIYHDKHKIKIGNDEEVKEANNNKNNSIIDGNDANNVKYAQLYQFSGTKRLSKWVWIPEKTGYVIRDFDKIRDKITNTNFGDEHGDYSGDYLLFEGDRPENGIVVAKENPMFEENPNTKGILEIKDNSLAANGSYFKTPNELKEAMVNSTIAQINWEEHPWIVTLNGVLKGGSDGNSKYFELKKQTDNSGNTINYYDLAVFVGTSFTLLEHDYVRSGKNPGEIFDYLPKNTIESGISSGRFACTKVVLNPDYIKTYQIPGHWEESFETPYVIHDVYEKVAQEPWFPYCTEHSLEKALEKAKALVDKIGLENVKLVKVVPTDQFLKIK